MSSIQTMQMQTVLQGMLETSTFVQCTSELVRVYVHNQNNDAAWHYTYHRENIIMHIKYSIAICIAICIAKLHPHFTSAKHLSSSKDSIELGLRKATIGPVRTAMIGHLCGKGLSLLHCSMSMASMETYG